MELYNARTMPLSNSENLRNIQKKIINGDNLTVMEKMVAGRDHPIKEFYGYTFRPDHAYRAVSRELLKVYMDNGFICGRDQDDEYIETTVDGKITNNNRGVDWYLGGVDLKYGDIVIECSAFKEYFVPAFDNGSGMSYDPTVRFLKSSGFKHPLPVSLISNVIDTKKIQEHALKNGQQSRLTEKDIINLSRECLLDLRDNRETNISRSSR